MALPSRRLTLVRDAIDVVLRRLAALPSTPDVDELRARAMECVHEADGWKAAAPTAEERERLMKRVLGLHTAVAKLERQAAGEHE